jgi:hypothetical protein
MVGNTDVIISDGINRNNHRFVLPDQITQCQAILYRVGLLTVRRNLIKGLSSA